MTLLSPLTMSDLEAQHADDSPSWRSSFHYMLHVLRTQIDDWRAWFVALDRFVTNWAETIATNVVSSLLRLQHLSHCADFAKSTLLMLTLEEGYIPSWWRRLIGLMIDSKVAGEV